MGKGDVFHESGRHGDALECFKHVLELQPDNIAGLTRVGIILRVQGLVEEAIVHYEDSIRRFPKIPELHYNLVIVYHRAGRLDAAIARLCFLLEMTPNDTAAQHLLATYEGKTTEKAPAEYVRELLDGYSETFEAHLVNKLGYKTPELIGAAVKKYWNSKTGKSVLDLGCGTGLFGVEIADYSSRLVGIDLSPKMIEKTRVKDIYTELAAEDILTYLQSCQAASFDLVVAVDVFVYVGVLDAIFAESHRVLRPGGMFAFSVESVTDVKDYVLEPTGRYKHSDNYLRQLARNNEMTELHFDSQVIRFEKQQPVSGYLCVFGVGNAG